MNTADFHLYSDASFSRQYQIGVAGFLLLKSKEYHRYFSAVEAKAITMPTKVDFVSNGEIRFNIFKETNNIRAELRGVIFAIEALRARLSQIKVNGAVPEFSTNLYIDSLSIGSLPDRRHRLESTNFLSKKTGMPLTNADLYQQFYMLCDNVIFRIISVKGHKPKGSIDAVHENFSDVDKAVRKELRKCLRRASTRSHGLLK